MTEAVENRNTTKVGPTAVDLLVGGVFLATLATWLLWPKDTHGASIRELQRNVEFCRFLEKQQDCMRVTARDCIRDTGRNGLTFDECYKVTGVKRPELKGGGE